MTKQKNFLLIVALGLWAASIFYLTAPAFAQSQDSGTVDFLVMVDMKVDNRPGAARIILRANRYFEYIDYRLEDNPFSITFDPAEPLYINFSGVDFDKNGIISNIRLIKGALNKTELPSILKEGFYPLDYFVVSLNKKADYRIFQRANLIVIDIGNTGLEMPEEMAPGFQVKNPVVKKEEVSAQDVVSDFINSRPPKKKKEEKKKPVKKQESKPAKVEPLKAEPPKVEPPKAEPQQPQPQLDTFENVRNKILARASAPKGSMFKLPQGKNVFNFNDSLEIATSNALPLVVAEEEMKLNDMKIGEAKRGLYPVATAKYTHTDGKTLGVKFREKTYGMEIEQPVYYGGRLRLTLKQAKVNRQVAQAKFDKAEADIVSKVTEAFYNMATAQLNVRDQEELFVKSKEALALAEKKYEQDLTTKLELLNVESQCNQIDYQLSVAVKDLDIARINLLQAMSIDPQADIKVDMSLNYTEHDIDLNKCLLLAYQNRPELHMNELLQEAADYEEKIAKTKEDLKVDFAGFLGQSGGAYKTEPLNMGSDWYVGVKASKPWLGNTPAYNFTRNKTSPKLGQSTRTEGLSNSLELGILNNLTARSEKQSALIGRLKSESELVETEKTINLEVREAYNNYEKAVMQIQNTLDKIKFRQEELKVLQSQAELNEAQLSQVLEAMVKLNDEKALYNQAIASYKTALANLNKTIGIIGYFQ